MILSYFLNWFHRNIHVSSRIEASEMDTEPVKILVNDKLVDIEKIDYYAGNIIIYPKVDILPKV